MDRKKLDSLKSKITSTYNFNTLLANGKKEQVVKKLTELIEVFAKKKRFAEADFIREWLIEIDPMALNVIIRSAEIIENAKAAAIEPHHLEIWRSLTQLLTREEFSALYHALVIRKYPNKKIILKQGTYFPALLFVNQGRVQLTTQADGKNVHLNTVAAGEVIGGRCFFDPSIWTMNLISEGSELAILSYKTLQHLKKEHPALESKLFDFCATFANPDLLLRTARKGRRSYIRNRVDGRAALLLLDKSGSSTGSGVKGDLYDISKGGISCLIRSSQKNNVIKLFGRKVRASLPSGDRQALSKNGVIVAVKGHHAAGNEYSVHVEFEKHLDDVDVQDIVYSARI